MNWSLFFTLILVLYGLWYLGNFLKDLLLAGRVANVNEDYTDYNIGDLVSEDPQEVHASPDLFLDTQEGSGSSVLGVNGNASEPKNSNETSISYSEPPTPVGEGISMSDFLKEAKEAAEERVSQISTI